MSIEKICNLLNSELNGYKPLPFWSWNGDLKSEHLIEQINKMKDYGIGGYFMHARNGLQTEYLSEDWDKAIKACAEYGEKIGMTSWIYDENGYPSGFAGGKLLDKEEYHDCYITHNIGKFDVNADINYLITENELVRLSEKKYDGEYLNLYIHRSIGTADVLNGEVTNEFIKKTHQHYKDYFGENFSKKISGVFTDEPQYYNADTAFTYVMVDYYNEKYNVNLFDGLGLLFLKKNGWRKFRYRYWKCMQELLVNNYAKKVFDWCEVNGIKLTGHYVEETSLGYQLMFSGGVMPLYEYMHIPGIDWLGSNTDNELSPRQVSSVAAQLNKKQVLTESFACCGWQIKPKNLKRILEFQFINGVNLLCHHLLPYSEYAIRKHDHPAHYSSFNPWIDFEFKAFNEYFTKLGFLISESEENINVAVLHPMRSAYFEYDRTDCDENERRFGLKEQDEQWRKDIRYLSSRGVNYHFLDESILNRHGYVKNNKIGCGAKEYEYLILPHIETMDISTEKFLKEYVLNGGKVLILGEKPKYLEGEEFSYSYLLSNCTIDEIIDAQPFKIENYDTDIFLTHRTIDGEDFIVALNTSTNVSYEQVFDFGDGVTSFEKLNLETLEYETVSLSLTLAPEESVILFPSNKSVVSKKQLAEYNYNPNNAEVFFDSNTLVVDMVSYSKNGKDYIGKYPSESIAIILGKEKYKGDIYFKYEFNVQNIPEKVFLKTEQGNGLDCSINGKQLNFLYDRENDEEVYISDISEFIKTGKNEYIVKFNWYQSPKVEYTLEGNNMDGSLGNMLTYDCEISPIHILGNFGVYAKKFNKGECGYVYANDFYIGETPKRITEPVFDGLPFFAGKLTLREKIEFKQKNIMLKLDGTQLLSYIKINGNYIGKLMFNDSIDISEYAKIGENEIEVDLILSNRNLYGPFHFSGNTFFGVGPNCWDMRTGEWIGNKNSAFRENYELLRSFL